MNTAKARRLDLGFTISQVCGETGVSYKTLRKLECGGEISAPALKRLGELYKVAPHTLLLPIHTASGEAA